MVRTTADANVVETDESVQPVIKAVPRNRLACCQHLEPHQVAYRGLKRILDVISGLAALLILLPVMIIIAILVKVTSPGPVFYRSTRIGLCGKKFAFIKFRTMRPDADKMLAVLQQQNEKDGPIFKMKNDPRITPVGRFLRKYSLDELPQFWSVVNGDMSMVGPRPPLPKEFEQYDDLAMRRLLVKPGITCYWQVMGRSNLTFEEWMELDRKYIEDMSFWTDIKIMLKTPGSVLKGDGAY
jgi:exopolysaccharide biosynthesis polyprenyl glycosylphosphotransferase